MFSASELNRRITLTAYDYEQQDSGGVIPVLMETFETWAKIEQRGGSMPFNQAQLMENASYQVTIRYRAKITTNWIVIYEGRQMKIEKIVTDLPNYKNFMIMDCSTVVQQTDWS